MGKTRKFKLFKFLSTRRGSVEVGFLLSLLVVFLALSIISPLVKILSRANTKDYLLQDEISSMQVSRLLAISQIVSISNNQLIFNHKNDEYKICLVNEKVIIQPGTQIIYPDVNNFRVRKEGSLIFFDIQRGDNEYENIIYFE